jgi:hypothetical protein
LMGIAFPFAAVSCNLYAIRNRSCQTQKNAVESMA